MKINIEGKTEFDRFDNAMKKLLSVSKEEMNRRLADDPRGHPKRKKKSKSIKPSQVSE